MCLNPITIYDKRIHVSRLVPCGKCLECLRDYQNSVKVRLESECKKYGYQGVFFTLTYAPSAVPVVHDAFDRETGEWFGDHDQYSILTPLGQKRDRHRILNLCVADVQGWLKRSRRRMQYANGQSKKWSYYITSEYGPKSLRPHYHGVFFGINEEEFRNYFLEDWHSPKLLKTFKHPRYLRKKLGIYGQKQVVNQHYKGNVKFERLRFDKGKDPGAVMDYVSKYCSKGLFENPRVAAGYCLKPFHLSSKGLGSLWLEENRAFIIQGYEDSFIEYGREFRDTPIDKLIQADEYYLLLGKFHKYLDKDTSVYQSGVRHPKSKWILPQNFNWSCYEDNLGYYVRPKITYKQLRYQRKDGTQGRPLVSLYKIPNIQHWYNKIYCLTPKLSFVKDMVLNRAFVVRYNKKKNDYFNIKLPRYYYEKLFPKDSPLRKAITELLQSLADAVYFRQLAKIQANRPALSFAQANSLYHLQLESSKREKADRLLRAFKGFFDRSKL